MQLGGTGSAGFILQTSFTDWSFLKVPECEDVKTDTELKYSRIAGQIAAVLFIAMAVAAIIFLLGMLTVSPNLSFCPSYKFDLFINA